MRSEYAGLLADLERLQGEVTLNGNHVYRYRGEYRPGVTTVAKTMDAPALDRWKVKVEAEGTARAAYANSPEEGETAEQYIARISAIAAKLREHERLSQEAADIGSQVHALIEYEVKAQLGQPMERPEASEEALFRFSGWRKWSQAVGLTPLASESRLYNFQHEYCGRLDLLCLVDGEPWVLDPKPTDALWYERRLQLAAYRKALVSMGWPEMRGAIVCLPRQGGDIRMVEAERPGPDLDAAFEAFLALLRVFRWQKQVDRR